MITGRLLKAFGTRACGKGQACNETIYVKLCPDKNACKDAKTWSSGY